MARPAAAAAEPITYTEQAVASGSLGASDFSDSLVTITVTADTATVSGPPGDAFNTGEASVTVASIGTARFADPLTAFALIGSTGTVLGITDAALFADLLDTDVAGSFLAYDLASPFGPVSGQSLISPATDFATSLGELNLLSADNSSFSADVANVPEPASRALFGYGLAALAAMRGRGRTGSY